MTPPVFQRLYMLLAALVLACIVGSLSATVVEAQITSQDPAIEITKVDVSKYPEVDAYISEENFDAEDAEISEVALFEDGVSQEIAHGTTAEVGIQAALILDAAGNIGQPGMTGEPRFIEAGLAARRLVELGVLSAETDWLIPIAFDQSEAAVALRDWSHDHQAVADALYTYQPVENIGYTPLFDLLRFAILRYEDADLPDDQVRNVVVFSDGIDTVSTTELTDAINTAQDRNIRIHTVMLGPESGEPSRNLRRIATLTGGRYLHLDSLEAVDDLWKLLGQQRNQTVLNYRSTKQQPAEITVGVKAGNRTLSDDFPFPPTGTKPAEIDIQSPAAGAVLMRTASAFDTPISEMEPRTLEVATALSWPDGRQRAIQRMEYELGGVTTTRDAGPFDEPFTLSIAELGPNSYSLRVRVIDELGIATESLPLTFALEDIRPPEPTPTPDATLAAETAAAQATAEAAALGAEAAVAEAKELGDRLEQTTDRADETAAQLNEQLDLARKRLEQMSWVSLASLVLGLVAVGLAIFILSSRDRRRFATEVVTGTVKAVTEPFMRGSRRSTSTASTAKLVLVDAGGTAGIPSEIPLHRGRVTIGRDPSMVNVPIDERRISRYHCRINEEGTSFRLWDEGSTSGTYVNDQEVGHAGCLLTHGDVVEIGPIQYRFEQKQQGNGSFEDPNLFDKTETYVRRTDQDQST